MKLNADEKELFGARRRRDVDSKKQCSCNGGFTHIEFLPAPSPPPPPRLRSSGFVEATAAPTLLLQHSGPIHDQRDRRR
jgi:hypothetical protein